MGEAQRNPSQGGSGRRASGWRASSSAAVLAIGAVPLIAGAIILAFGLQRAKTTPGASPTPAGVAGAAGKVPDRVLGTDAPSGTPLEPLRVPDEPGETPAAPGTVIRRTPPVNDAIRTAVEAAESRAVQAELSLGEVRTELESSKRDNMTLREQLAATEQKLSSTSERVGNLVREIDERLSIMRQQDEKLQNALQSLAQAEEGRRRELAARQRVEGERDSVSAALDSTLRIYGPLAPVRIEHRRLSLLGRQLAEQSELPLGPLWDGVGDMVVGVLEAFGGPGGDTAYVAVFAGGGEAVLDEAAARRWIDIGVPLVQFVPAMPGRASPPPPGMSTN